MKVLEAYPWIPERFADCREDHGGAYLNAACPLKCHRTASVRFWLGSDGRLLFGCYACGPAAKLEILRAVGATWADCYPERKVPDRPEQVVADTYAYRDEAGTVLYVKDRLEPGRRRRDKDFRFRRPDPARRGKWLYDMAGVRRVLFLLPELLASPPTAEVWVVAGEKDVRTLVRLGYTATTNDGGESAAWSDDYSRALAGRAVVVVEDADATGRRAANERVGSIADYAASVRRVRLPEKDATAFVNRLRAAGVTGAADLRANLEAERDRTRILVGAAA